MAEEKENPADYGTPKYQAPLKGIPEQPLKKDIKAGKVITSETDTKLSTETPDPNVTSVGDTTDTTTSGTNTGRANTTRSSSTTSGNTTTSGSGSSS
jgi:hypothetical protein